MARSGVVALIAAFAAGLVACQLCQAFVAAPLGHRGPLGHPEVHLHRAGSPGEATASQSAASAGIGLTMIGASAALALLARRALSGASGKATTQGSAQHKVVMAAFESELGVQDPVGFWDPAGFTADGSTENFARRRQTELKHGRVSMLATMGYITPELTGKLPGYLSPSAGLKFADIPNGLGAISKVPAAGWAQIVAYGAFCELSQDQSAGTAAAAGDFGWKVLTSSDAAEKQSKLAAEIANGRLAMMAIIGMFFQDGLTGSAWGDWVLYTGSPLRAFENEIGVQDPMGFWDPAGFTFDGNTENFARRRQTELKHGRVCMLATIGYIFPENFGKWPGYLSPSSELKFADIPNGLGAISKVPAAGWVQIIAYCAYCEVSQNQSPGTPAAAGDFGWKVITSSDPVEKQKKLAAEIANGRLAMMAIIGMFFQDGLTGSAWGDWANYTDSPLRAFESELGVQAPVGFWDPAGLSKDGDAAAFKRRRSTEIKHGRVSMLATMGYITPEVAGKFPGFLSPSKGLAFEDIPNGLAAISKVPALGWIQIVIYCLYVEASGLGFNYIGQGEATPGDVGWKPPLLSGFDGEAKTKKLNAEIANGRLAMVAIIGMFFQDGLTGSAWGDWANYTDSPLRAFESELGVQAPLGFWDPIGFTKDGDAEKFRRRRTTEIKHGRISMLATMGYITPEVTGKFPGFLSPSQGLAFEDVPNGLAALSKVPVAGWLQMVAYCFFCERGASVNGSATEKGNYVAFGETTPGDVGWKPPLLSGFEGEAKTSKLNAEIANGRLAMVAIIGMFYQDGLTGSAWGDWANYTDSPLRAFESELGVQAPVGYWDPAGYSRDGDADVFRRRRITEIKHGRVSMIACIGYIVPEYFKWPGYCSPGSGLRFEDVPNGLAAISKISGAGWVQVFAFAGFLELNFFAQDDSRAPGDFANAGPLGVPNGAPSMTSAEARKVKLNAEIANGRLAMMAIIGMFFQDGLTGSAWGDWELYTASPLRAFESELGVQDPVGFWDPAGFTADGSTENFARRRQTELKHGRVSMLATMGYITPELTGKLPGYLSPSAGLKFADIPNGLGAISKVPAAGWAQIVAYGAFCELSQDQSAGTAAAAGDFGWKVLTSSDAAEKQSKLAAEIANGRLAMMAIIGMFFQDGLTGSAWGDWALYTGSPLRAFESELGVQAPVGFWDPLGLSQDGDVATFKRRRETELKHGRVSMYATIGYIMPEFYRFEGYLSPSSGLKFSDVPNGLAACSKVPSAGWFQVILFCGCFEAGWGYDAYTRDGEPGNYGWKALTSDDPAVLKRKLNAELANGRLAMMAIIGMFYQDGLTGSAWGDWASYTDSPLRAFESELGVQPPVGFWDPVGFTKDGDAAAFKRRRETEIKHGRVSMLATMGYITPELVGKFPGEISPSLGVKFEDIPNGLAALSKVPGPGWLQIVAYCLYCESGPFGYNSDPNRKPGELGWRPIGLYSTDATVRQRRLAAEIANGRLAMMAIIGMFFQDGLTGSAWGDWANYTDSPLRAFESELGVQAPVGFWDPAGLSKDGDAEAFKRRRTTEIKHGRISMLATMGYITPEVAGKFPGYLSPSKGLAFEDIPNGLAAISKVPFLGWIQIVIYCLYCEASGLGFNYIGQGEPTPGDVGWKPPLLSGFDGEAKTKKLNAEIANGRLAMVAIIGMFFQDGLTGSAWGDWANYTDSPLRAFESELGVQAPLGFWDPLGLSADGDVKSFKRRRSVEIKHGRICMLATMGYITPEVAGKWPGFISKSEGLKFADIPNGLAAISKVPGLGWLQIASWFAFCEIQQGYDTDAKTEPGNVGWKPPLLVSADPETRKRRLNAEIANGRLAMVAIIGMFFQDGLTGSAWGDWALYTGSPLRAFESELGVQAPTGFWDPAGFCKDGDADEFTRRRVVEIKHGRVSMIACIGYIVPEYFKWPGYCAPTKDLAFADIPNGLAAFSKVPSVGWAQMFLFAGLIDFGYLQYDPSRDPGDYKNAGVFGVLNGGGWGPMQSAEDRKKKLNAEIANGRLAMMAIIGMFFQDGLTGSAWGDWELYTASPLRAFESELGVQAPTGFWDPLGYTNDGSVENFQRRRSTEIKHGRVSMYATMGYIFPEYVRFPGLLSPSSGLKFTDVPNGLAALSKVPAAGWLQIFLFVASYEVTYTEKVGDPGNYGKGWLGTGIFGSVSDPAKRTRGLNSEIANGRLAMMAIIGMFYQDGLTGSAWGDWANFADSPLRAFENELGVQAPVGFWDPIGFTADGDEAAFKRRRQTELKHGRISMLATMGYITPELGVKWSGYLSPSMGIKFADVPNGLKAISAVPALGWAQIIAYMAMCEVSQDQSPGTKAAEGDFGWKVLTSEDPEALKRKLSAEVANGRLAMMAIIGMFYQDGLTGSAWGDWANYADSPLRAFESETGVQAPVGFWDPLGLSADGSAFNFARRREVELKHGRVSMFATIGYMVPEYYKLPGFLSPSYGVEFADVPNGLGALSKVPALGWLQIVLLAGVTEIQIYKDTVNGEPGNYGAGFLGCKSIGLSSAGWSDPEARKVKLNAELANGRLAMMAIIGMFFQDGLTGSAWGDWANYTDSPLR